MQKNATLFLFYLFLISCVGQIASDIYLPALPVLREALHTNNHWVQVSVSIFMAGFAASHLFYGPVSDSVGRKSPLIIGISICLLGSIVCLLTTNIWIFLIGRLLQGLGAGASATLFRSILRDVYSGNYLAKVSSILAIARVVILASSTLIGGYLLHFFNWEAAFIFVSIFSGICLIWTIYSLQETNQYQDTHQHTLAYMLSNGLMLIKHRIFMGYSITVMVAYGAILAWLTALPIVLQEVVGLSPVQFGWTATGSGLFFIAGGVINATLVTRLGINNLLKLGLTIMALAGTLMVTLGYLLPISTMSIMTPIVIFIFGASMIFSNAYAGAMTPFPELAGTAGAIFGCIQIAGGAATSMLMSFMHHNNQLPLAYTLLIGASLALVLFNVMIKKEDEAPSADIAM